MVTPRIFIIAEAGVNHNGDLALARRLVEVAATAGADALKFQTFRADALVRIDAPKAGYQVETTGDGESQYEMLRKLELGEEAHMELACLCREAGIEFLSTPFDETAVDLLARIGVVRYKIASGEITNLLLLRHIAAKGRPVILSTGMSRLEEIGAALAALRAAGAVDVTLLHCVSDYPTRAEDVNLRVMDALRERFGVPVGFSDHTRGITVAIAAAARGAVAIEKHFTLDRSLPGPDHRASLEPEELKKMIASIREVERALGDGVKRLTMTEIDTQKVARKSLVAREGLPAGTVLLLDHLAAKRPASGLSPMELDALLGRRLKRPIRRDEDVRAEDIE